jgi:hypothetical protein
MSEQRTTAEADIMSFQKEFRPFAVAVETMRMAMIFADAEQPDNPIVVANEAFFPLQAKFEKSARIEAQFPAVS